MQKSTPNVPPASSNTPFSLEGQPNSNSSEELLRRTDIPNSPFHVLGNKEHGYGICFGKYRLTELFAVDESSETKIYETAHLILQENQWTIIARLAGVIADITLAENAKNNSKEKPHD